MIRLPTPGSLADMEKKSADIRLFLAPDLCSFGARAFLRLNRDDDAYKLARLAVAPEQGTKKKTTLVICHSILGQVAAKRGDTEEAKGHFARALEEASVRRLPMLEVVAARDWRNHLLSVGGGDCSVAEAVIDAACAAMAKTRGQLARVLGVQGHNT